jgi:hypothetical protein
MNKKQQKTLSRINAKPTRADITWDEGFFDQHRGEQMNNTLKYKGYTERWYLIPMTVFFMVGSWESRI